MTTSADLFAPPRGEPLGILDGLFLLRERVDSEILEPALRTVLQAAPPRRMRTPRGGTMSVAMSNCGALGWVSDTRGYRYSKTDPVNGEPWPAMPPSFHTLATDAAAACGFAEFDPDVCLINRYEPGNRMGAHQDRDEQDARQPIVSVSLGIPARFFVVGPERLGRATPVDLRDGDVLVFGGTARLHYHGVRPIKPAEHARFGAVRWNLTFRRALGV